MYVCVSGLTFVFVSFCLHIFSFKVMSCGRDPILRAAEAVAMVLASEGCCFTTGGGKCTLYRVTHPKNRHVFSKATQYCSVHVLVCSYESYVLIL